MALYPPVVASSMPAFDKTLKSVRIYFSLSDFNSGSMNDIAAVHVSVRFQSSNVNALKQSTAEILSLNWEYDNLLNKYYVTIPQEAFSNKCIKNGNFIPDKIYKVQLRFSTVQASDSATSQWFIDNIDNFSQWSTVCLIKPITAPLFYIEDFDSEGTGKDSKQDDENNFFSSFADFIITYKQQKSSEVLNSYRVRLLDSTFTKEDLVNINQYTLADSKQQIVSATNYNLNSNNLILESYIPYKLIENTDYKLYVQIFTKNDYTKGILYNFTYTPQIVDEIKNPKLLTYVNEEQGYIKLDFTSSQTGKMTNIVIRRTDSKSNFTIWEDLKNFQQSDINFTYYDFTVQSGIAYRYLVQKRDSRGRRGAPAYDSSNTTNMAIIPEWNHAFLLQTTGNGDITSANQLKLKYDFQISSYKTNISESKTDTIGSKYPFIRRNGNMYYRSFPITGTITALMDDAKLFTSQNQMYNNQNSIYKQYRGSLGAFTTIYDYTKERLFREKVEQFLYNSKPKLYKSMQQGNIFIKLMQVSLTPKNELGRLIYSFSATAYEIDQACIETYDKYNFISVGQYNPNLTDSKTVMSQLSSYSLEPGKPLNSFKAGKDIIGTDSETAADNSLAKSIKYKESFNGQIVNNFKINWLRITIESEPYLIGEYVDSNGKTVFIPIDDVEGIIPDGSSLPKSVNTSDDGKNIAGPPSSKLYQLESTYKDSSVSNQPPLNIYLGTLFMINGQPIIISPPNNIYELNEQNFSFNSNVSIVPQKDTVMSVDYRVDTSIIQDTSLIPKSRKFDFINGQLSGKFNPDEQLIYRLDAKYQYSYQDNSKKIKKYVQGVNTVSIDTEPGTVVKLKTSASNLEYRFVINETGELKFDPMDSSIYITSLKMFGKNYIYNNKNNVIQTTRNSIEHPFIGQICKENNNYYYFNNSWYPCTVIIDDGNNFIIDVKCQTTALIFYNLTLGRDEY